MFKQTKIAMLVTTPGSPDGITVKEYKAGGVYSVPADLAANFLGQGVAEQADNEAEEGEPQALTAHQVDGRNAGVTSWATLALSPGLLALLEAAGVTPEAYLERKAEIDAAETLAHAKGMTLAELVAEVGEPLEEVLAALAEGRLVMEPDADKTGNPGEGAPDGTKAAEDPPAAVRLSAPDAIARIKALGNAPEELAELEAFAKDERKTVCAAAVARLAAVKE